jgi:hypothetical protein
LIAPCRSAVRALRRDLFFLFTSAALKPLERHRAFAASQQQKPREFLRRVATSAISMRVASAPSGAPAIVVF